MQQAYSLEFLLERTASMRSEMRFLRTRMLAELIISTLALGYFLEYSSKAQLYSEIFSVAIMVNIFAWVAWTSNRFNQWRRLRYSESSGIEEARDEYRAYEVRLQALKRTAAFFAALLGVQFTILASWFLTITLRDFR